MHRLIDRYLRGLLPKNVYNQVVISKKPLKSTNGIYNRVFPEQKLESGASYMASWESKIPKDY